MSKIYSKIVDFGLSKLKSCSKILNLNPQNSNPEFTCAFCGLNPINIGKRQDVSQWMRFELPFPFGISPGYVKWLYEFK